MTMQSIMGLLAGRLDWEQAAAAADLQPGERLLALVPAITPPPDYGSGGMVLPGLVPLIPLIMAARRAAWRKHARAAAASSGVPLAPRMIICLTDRRLVICTARGRWRTGAALGSVWLDRIIAADAPTVGSGWRTVLIHLAGQPKLTIKVPATAADRLAAALSDTEGGDSAAATTDK
jgi:hypothetical protein